MNKPEFPWYLNGETIQRTATEMITFSGEVFKRASVIQKLEDLQRLIDSHKPGNLHDPEFHVSMEQFFFEKITDAFKISMFFENYMKAVLLLNDYLIHKIVRANGFEVLAIQQNKRPVKTSELNAIKPFEVDAVMSVVHHEGLSSQTITMGTMLSKVQYANVIQLPETIRQFLSGLAEKRNDLHFINGWEFELSQQYLDDLYSINRFVDQIVKSLHPV